MTEGDERVNREHPPEAMQTLIRQLGALYEDGRYLTDPECLAISEALDHLVLNWYRETGALSSEEPRSPQPS